MEGKVKMIDKAKGFGFITPNEGKDLFFGSKEDPSEFAKLEKDDMVTFEAGESPRGPMAKNVKKMEKV